MNYCMKTTVVIPNYNGIDYLRDCLESLKECSYEDFKVIVVDNGSTDGSADMVRESFPEYTLIELTSNTGFAYAVNRGIEAADTEYVLLLNNDTKVRQHFVSNLEKALDSDERIFSASARMLSMADPDIMDGAGDYYCALGWAYAYAKGRPASKADKARRIFSSCAGAAIYRKSILDEIGYFDEAHFAYLEDVDIGYRARIKGYINVYEPTAEVLHAGSGYSGSRYNEFKVKLSSRNSTYLICKNMPILQQLVNLPFLMTGFGIKTVFFVLKGYGKVYIRGLLEGISLGYSKSGRDKKVRFTIRELPNYISIELQLLAGIVRRLL